MIHVERATAEHARAIAPHLTIFGCTERFDDSQRELLAVRHVERSIEAFTWLQGDRPLAMAGVVSLSLVGRVGAVWLLATPEAFANVRAFWRASKATVAYLHHEYPRLEGRVDTSFTTSQRWLKRLGFNVITGLKGLDEDGRTFFPFEMER